MLKTFRLPTHPEDTGLCLMWTSFDPSLGRNASFLIEHLQSFLSGLNRDEEASSFPRYSVPYADHTAGHLVEQVATCVEYVSRQNVMDVPSDESSFGLHDQYTLMWFVVDASDFVPIVPQTIAS